ncbi:MAG: MBOAT family protein [Lachnospiraceae bacterium]|nr:MBOAT family protein [Lachnospiraceae bacterium]
MVFSSFVFVWLFLPVVIAGNYVFQKIGGNRAANAFLLVASLFFYAWGEPVYILLMLFSIVVNWASGVLLERTAHRKAVLAADVIINLCLLGFFKYTMMAVSTFNMLTHANVPVPEISLPIGISFFTFQALSYVIDVYRKECDVQKNVLKLALYVSFFPQLIAGPIVKYHDVAEQIDHRVMSAAQTAEGVRRFIYGFGKKVILTNTLAACVDEIYGLPLMDVSGVLIWIASLMYILQIYYDFSGYSDMAIGLGKMFGFDFKENFNYPYLSRSVTEFWRRWHISLGAWFRDYLYVPLGGSRKGKIRTDLNLFAVFLLTGLWHGASWNYVLFGLIPGIVIIVEKNGLGKLLEKRRILSHVYVLLYFCLTYTIFRYDSVSTGLRYVLRQAMPWRYPGSGYTVREFLNPHVLLVFAAAFAGSGFLQNTAVGKKLASCKHTMWETFFLLAVFVLSLLSLIGNTYNPFIYFRF